MSRRASRREFLRNTALVGAGVWVATRSTPAESKSPNEKLNIGIIGAGGRGRSDLKGVSSENIVALCDVDEKRAAESLGKYPKAKRYHDFRMMLEQQKDLDAVVVSTPDHTHAPAAVMAMKLGKHVYCEKPLTHSVYEARVMRETAAQYKVATQMGNQGTAQDGFRRCVEVIQSGAIGPVREVHVWTNRPIWPQAMDRPKDTPPVPNHVDWYLWLGPAPDRPYHPGYVPHDWRGWWDFGTGALGDMACHTVNLPFMALKLGYPNCVEAKSAGINPETYPEWSIICYEFPARGDLPPVKLTWYDGGKKPSEALALGQELEKSGVLIVGKKGTLYSPDDYGRDYKLLPEGEFEGYQPPEPSLPRSPGHHKEWILACKGGEPAMSNFDYAGILTESVLLGNLALRVGKKIDWDGPNLKGTNCPEAAQYVRREYREGWTV